MQAAFQLLCRSNAFARVAPSVIACPVLCAGALIADVDQCSQLVQRPVSALPSLPASLLHLAQAHTASCLRQPWNTAHDKGVLGHTIAPNVPLPHARAWNPQSPSGACDRSAPLPAQQSHASTASAVNSGISSTVCGAITQHSQQAAATAPGGWTRADVINTANVLSFSRLLAGPGISYLILQQQWALAVPALVAAGITDWLDGLAARKLPGNQPSVLGSYLDPLADKVLICCVVAALGVEGTLSPWLVSVVVGRDVYLIAGATYHRCAMLQWKWPGWAEFFRIRPNQDEQDPPFVSTATRAAPVAPAVQPLLISKANTVLQLLLVAGAMAHSWLDAPSAGLVEGLGYATLITTVWSCAEYTRLYVKGKLFIRSSAVA